MVRYHISSQPVDTVTPLDLACRMHLGNAPVMKGILGWANSSIVRTIQQHFRQNGSIGLLWDWTSAVDPGPDPNPITTLRLPCIRIEQ